MTGNNTTLPAALAVVEVKNMLFWIAIIMLLFIKTNLVFGSLICKRNQKKVKSEYCSCIFAYSGILFLKGVRLVI